MDVNVTKGTDGKGKSMRTSSGFAQLSICLALVVSSPAAADVVEIGAEKETN